VSDGAAPVRAVGIERVHRLLSPPIVARLAAAIREETRAKLTTQPTPSADSSGCGRWWYNVTALANLALRCSGSYRSRRPTFNVDAAPARGLRDEGTRPMGRRLSGWGSSVLGRGKDDTGPDRTGAAVMLAPQRFAPCSMKAVSQRRLARAT
jgi:hypothetical protein